MGFKFTLENSVIENSEVFSHVNGIMEEADIVICGVKLTKSKLFTDLDIPQFCASVQNQHLDNAEKNSLQNVLKKQTDKKAFVDALIQHIASFTEGVAASIVANYIMR